MEAFMGKHEKTGFGHRGSLVYTPTPSKDGPTIKVGTPQSSRSGRRPRRFGEGDPAWIEQLNQLTRLEGNNGDEVLASPLCNAVQEPEDWVGLQSDGLKEELWERDCLLNSVVQRTRTDDVEVLDEISRLQKRVEELEREVGEKDVEAQCARREIEVKQNEIEKMKALLETAEDVDSRTDEKAMYNEELNELRCQIEALQYQLQVANLRNIQEFLKLTSPSQDCQPEHAKDHLGILDRKKDVEGLMAEEDELDQTRRDMENLEISKRQYFAALITAREKPGEETFALVAGFRTQLESLLAIPSLSSYTNDTIPTMHRGRTGVKS